MSNKILIICRKIIDYSQQKMADSLGISITSYNQKEKGKIDFTRKEMIQIVSTLNDNGLKLSIEDVFFKNEVSIKVTSC